MGIMLRMETGDRLRFAMDKKEISIKELSDRAHITVPTLKRYLEGKQMPLHLYSWKLADALDVEADWLRGLDVPMIRPRSTTDSVYSEGDKIIKRIMEDPDEDILYILMDMPSDELKSIKEMLKNYKEK